MAIGKHKPNIATRTDLRKAIHIGLDECMTAFEECFHDLTDEEVWRSRPIPNRHNVGTIVMHALANLNFYALQINGSRSLLEEEKWFDLERHSPQELDEMQERVPTVPDVVELLHKTRDAISALLESTSDDQLLSPRLGSMWFDRHPGRTVADAYMRTIMHTTAHVRQIWLLRGAIGATGKKIWPRQHWA